MYLHLLAERRGRQQAVGEGDAVAAVAALQPHQPARAEVAVAKRLPGAAPPRHGRGRTQQRGLS
eukprot:scaffold46098_cov49-Phaeocystis_antarctica.AAC.2